MQHLDCIFFHSVNFSSSTQKQIYHENCLTRLFGALLAVCDSCFGQIVRGHFHRYAIADNYFDVLHPHFAAQIGHNDHAVLQFYAEVHIRQQFLDSPLKLYSVFFCH